MTWFLNANLGNESVSWALQDGVDVNDVQKSIAEAVPGTFVKIPVRLLDQLKTTTVYFDPSKWGAWMIHESSQEEVL